MLVGLKYSEFSIHHRYPLSSLIYIYIYIRYHILLYTVSQLTPRGFTHQPLFFQISGCLSLWKILWSRSFWRTLARGLRAQRFTKDHPLVAAGEGHKAQADVPRPWRCIPFLALRCTIELLSLIAISSQKGCPWSCTSSSSRVPCLPRITYVRPGSYASEPWQSWFCR